MPSIPRLVSPPTKRSIFPTFLLLSSITTLALGLASIGCDRRVEEPSGAEAAILERQVEGLEKLVASGRSGRLIPFEQGLLVIDQSLIQNLLNVALPYETRAGEQFRIRILDATATCEDGVALVRLHGRASFANQPEETAFAEATLYGSLREFDLKRAEKVLRGRVDVIAFEMRRVQVLGQDDEAVRGLLRDLARLRLEAFQGMDYSFDIPVRLVDDIVLPAFSSRDDITIPAARLPLRISVTDVNALRGKLWISVRMAEADSLRFVELPADSMEEMR